MWWIIGLEIIICVLYSILVSVFIIGWKRIKPFALPESEEPDFLLSVVVPCRDEEKNVEQLILDLAQQTYQNVELIVVNDHSVDATRALIEKARSRYPTVQLVDAIGFGKKNALREGILKATGDLIVTTDADCLHAKQWLQTIAAFQKEQSADLIICPVSLSSDDSLFLTIQRFEFTSLVASGAGAAGLAMPILCNGANLAFKKRVWLRSQDDLHEEELSGDDMFLLESIKRAGGKIQFLKAESAFAVAGSAGSMKSLFKQRRRWASKSPAYTDWQIIFTACLIFSVNLIEMVLLGLAICDREYLIPFLILFLCKYMLDTFFLSSVRRFFQLKNVWFNSLILSVVYPFYIVMVGASALIVKPKGWK
jgi:cellulose synthase/poly-beta-1,6-N-acetylglucosamine synthase-like glycosyltransferase